MKKLSKLIGLISFTLLCAFNAKAEVDCEPEFTMHTQTETLFYKAKQAEFILDRYTAAVLSYVGPYIKAEKKKEFYPVPSSALDDFGAWRIPDLLQYYSGQFKAINSLACLSNKQLESGKLTELEYANALERLEYLKNLKKTSKTSVSRIIQKIKKDIGDFPSKQSDIDMIADEMFNSYDVTDVYLVMKPVLIFMADRDNSRASETDLHAIGHLMEYLSYYASYMSKGDFRTMDVNLIYNKAQGVLKEYCPSRAE